MRVLILTSSEKSTASYVLPYLLNSPKIEVVAVIYCRNKIVNKKKYAIKKLLKVLKIGALASINGIRLRSWYGSKLQEILTFENLEEICIRGKVPFFITNTISCEQTKEVFNQYSPDLGLSLSNSYIPFSVFSLPKLGMINIHHEVLPSYPNAQSVIWQLYNGSSITGYTIHKINKSIDKGAILYSEKVAIQFSNTLQKTVTDTMVCLLESSAKGLVHLLENYEDYESNSTRQDPNHFKVYTTPSIRQFIKIYKNWKLLYRKTIS